MGSDQFRFAMIGTRGVPARYGGFETAVEEVGSRLVERGHRVDVYCRNPGQRLREHNGMRLINLPALRRRSLETLSHSALSVLHSLGSRPDAMVIFNMANAPFLPLVRLARIPATIHVDGLEWKRAKWEGLGAKYYKRAEGIAARSGMPLIADAQGIADHLRDAYGSESHLIPYGAPILDPDATALPSLGLEPGGYHLVVARMEPENHISMILRGYQEANSEHPLVVVGAAPYASDYTREVDRLAQDPRIRMLGAVWDQDLLNQLYGHCLSYVHGHSVGGTNPSLLRALGCGAPVTAFDVTFNREVTDGNARFFGDAAGVTEAVKADDRDPEAAFVRGKEGQVHVAATYRWDDVADAYEDLMISLARSRAR